MISQNWRESQVLKLEEPTEYKIGWTEKDSGLTYYGATLEYALRIKREI